LRASASDYTAITGVRNWTQLVAPTAAETHLTDIGLLHGVLRGTTQDPAIAASFAPQMRIADVTDGTSNTFLIGELGGRPDLYNARREHIGENATFGAGWGDMLNGEHWPNGTSANGNLEVNLIGEFPPFPDWDQVDPIIPVGTCLINCSNYHSRGFYSFHTGGVNFLLADGSVRYFAESTSPRVIVFMITSQRGEVVPSN
jgi:prepilin-type processing-associated H-X9-DG protein